MYLSVLLPISGEFINIAEILLEKQVDVNAETKDGQTPLKWAKEQTDTKIIELLRKHGAKE